MGQCSRLCHGARVKIGGTLSRAGEKENTRECIERVRKEPNKEKKTCQRTVDNKLRLRFIYPYFCLSLSLSSFFLLNIFAEAFF